MEINGGGDRGRGIYIYLGNRFTVVKLYEREEEIRQ